MLSWKRYLFYGSLIVIGGLFIFLTYETYKAGNLGFETKTYWDWMELFIIPLVLAIGAFFLNRSERETEREIAKDRQQDAALQVYIDRMSELMLKEKLRTTKKAEVRDVARTRTISIMQVLDTKRNNFVIQFLREAKLITDENSILNGADMRGMNFKNLNFSGVTLNNVNLRGGLLTNANLGGANLEEANLNKAHLEGASLMGAHFGRATLVDAHLGKAILIGTDFTEAALSKANLKEAFLANANLKRALLTNANLEGAELIGANLEGVELIGAKISDKQLASAKSLKDATMPDGTIHE